VPKIALGGKKGLDQGAESGEKIPWSLWGNSVERSTELAPKKANFLGP